MTVNNTLQSLDGGIYRTITTGSRFKFFSGNIQSEAGNRTDSYSAGHLKIFQFDAMVTTSVCTRQYQNIIIMNIFLAVGKFQEFFIYFIQFFLIQCHPQNGKAIFQGSTSATGSQHNRIIINTYIMRINYFISLHILKYSILMDTRRMCKCIASHNGLISLYRHIHQTRYHAAGRINLLSIDIRLNINLVMALNNHCYLFKGCISGTFTDTVDGNFYLTGTVQYTGHRVGSSHSQVIMTMGRNNRILDTSYMIYQIFNFRSIL